MTHVIATKALQKGLTELEIKIRRAKSENDRIVILETAFRVAIEASFHFCKEQNMDAGELFVSMMDIFVDISRKHGLDIQGGKTEIHRGALN